MKQMINNHREIESLEDFIYFDKSTGKIKITKPVVDGSGNPISGVSKEILGTALLAYDGTQGSFVFERENQLNTDNYDLLLFTAGGSLVVFISSQVLNTDSGLKGVGNFIVLTDGTTNLCKCKLTQTFDGEMEKYNINLTIVSNIEFTCESYQGILIGIKF